jgi:8-oxo-dGTP pyrophosphatase MutT (NUDIX family)
MRPSDLNEEEIGRRLADIAGQIHSPEEPLRSALPQPMSRGQPTLASVLVPLMQVDHDWRILLTRRTDTLVEHSGQVAFPGGRAELGDRSPEDTALREAREEIGLESTHVHILGRLDSLVTITNYILTPVVGSILWPFPIRLEENEVQRVFTIPLNWLADPVNHEVRQWTRPPLFPDIPVIYFHPYDGETLWGVSAQITMNLLHVLFK